MKGTWSDMPRGNHSEAFMKTNISSRPVAGKSAGPSRENQTAAVVCAVLMPHAPILVPEVGGERGGAAQASCQAMREAAAYVMSFRPETLVLISPHSPRQPRAFGVWAGERLQGSFAQFNAPRAQVSLPNDTQLAHAIVTEAKIRDLATWMIHDRTLDHGALVPLWFLAEAGWAGPIVVLSLNYPQDGGLGELGEAIAAAAHATHRRIAIVASGDMSHRLTPDAPCGFHHQAHQFDETFIRLVRDGDYHEIRNIDPELRELAAEDAVDSTLVAAAAVDWRTTGHKVLNYEGPFGVGYGVAILFAEKSNPADRRPAPAHATNREGVILPGLARQSVTAALRGSSELPPAATGQYLSAQRGVFVTVHERSGMLRGCAGTILAVCANLVAETWRSARLAALEDSRFPPVEADELPNLSFDVSVLHSMEKVSSADELDPAHYGVVVSTEDGRRGLLLPGIADIKTREQQLGLARKKGWIGPDEPVMLQRFQVDYFKEQVG
jgi:AmmeMemoRadiSam system protein A/AmmeMemoRadiSam system protein B